MTKNINPPSARGPLDHAVREQIVEAAFEHFGHYGYEKTTVAELAKSIGFSKSYIYKFFDSKQAIGEVICANRLELIMAAVLSAIDAVAAQEQWPSTQKYSESLMKLIESIIIEGRQAGEFERKTPLDEVTFAVYMVMCPYINPVQLQYNLEMAPTAAVLLSSLILRSLAP